MKANTLFLLILLLWPLPACSRAAKDSLEFRAILAGYTDPREENAQEGKDFWDKQAWDQRLSQWSREGFNAVVWIGANESGAAARGGGHVLLRHDEFPEARELTREKNEQIIAQMKWLLKKAKSLGMRNFLYTHLVWVTPAYAKAHGLDKPMDVSATVAKFHNEPYGGTVWPNCGVVNEKTRAYTEAVFAEFPRIYQDLDGFYADIGEALPGHRTKFYRDAVVPGLRRCGRKPVMIALQWQLPIEDFLEDVAPTEVYDNTWLGFHGYNSEQITDAKPYPGLVDWSERVGLSTVAAVYPANNSQFPFNSPKFAYEITREMKKIKNFVGYLYWEYSYPMSPLFRKALARYAKSDEPYSDEPWVALLEEQYGDRKAAQHFLNAYNISGRIIPEMCALVFHGGDGLKRELRLPYHFMTEEYLSSWVTSPVRAHRLVPITAYAKMVAINPNAYKDKDGSDPNRYPYFQRPIWRSQGGSMYDVPPPAHMRKVRDMGEACLREAEKALKTVKKNRKQAEHTLAFMNAHQMMAHYYERKVAAGTAALVYARSRRAEDKQEAEQLAQEALVSYKEAANFMQEHVSPGLLEFYDRRFIEFPGRDLPALIEAETQERQQLAEIFQWE